MRTLNSVRLIGGVAVATLLMAVQAHATIAYVNPVNLPGSAGDGYQNNGTYNLGMEFTVLDGQAISVTALGAYDNQIQGDGILAPVEVAIYRVSDHVAMTPILSFFGTPGTLIDSSRFLNITPVTLGAGAYMIVAGGYGTIDGSREMNWNAGYAGMPQNALTTQGDGVLTFQGNYNSAWTGSIGFPTGGDGSPIPRYAAGTFNFTPVPEVATFGAAAVGLLGLLYLGRCARLRHKVRSA